MPRKHNDTNDNDIHLPGVHYDPFNDTPSHFHCDSRIFPSMISPPFNPMFNAMIRDTEDVLNNKEE